MEKLFLLDAYALIYRAYYGFIRNPRMNSKGENTSAIFGFVNTLEDVFNREHPTHIAIAFDPAGKTFRHDVYKPYKAQREETPEDIRRSIPIIKEIIAAYNIPVFEVSGYEADDVIGTIATRAAEQKIETVMMTPDKDYAQLVGEYVKMYKPKNGNKPAELLGVEEVKEKFQVNTPLQVIDLLGLMGDAADNIPGCPGVGPKTAQKLIAEFGSIEGILENTEKLKGAVKKKIEENKEEIRFSKFLATIKLDVPMEIHFDDLKRKEINKEKLTQLFNQLEFKTFLTRIIGEEKKVKENQPVEADLFSVFADEDKGEDENQNLRTLKESLYSYHIIDNQEERAILLKKLLSKKNVCIDTQTTSTEAMTAKLVGISFCFTENEAYYVPIPDSLEETSKIVKELSPFFEKENIVKVSQNMKNDLIVLSNHGATIRGQLFDTTVAHYILQPELNHNLNYLAEIYLNYQTIKIEELIGAKGKEQKTIAQLPADAIYEYACEKADITFQLKTCLEKQLKKEKDEALFNTIEMPLVSVLATMERNGVCLDTQALKKTSIDFTNQLIALEKEITEMAGMSFNISSPKQVGEVLFDKLKLSEKAKKTKSGQYSTSEEILMKLEGKHAIISKILEYRGIKKLLNTYVDALPQLINPVTGKIHTSFNQTITATGRLSSSNPNLQNIPIREKNGKEIRKAFIPEEGCAFFSADYSQIELRIMAHLSKDENMIAAFNEKQDIHAATAAKVYKKPIEEVTSAERSKAKTANFGIIYGISIFGLAERMKVDRKEAKELIEGYFQTYPRVKEYMDESIHIAQERGYVETIFHRKRFLQDINSHNAIVRGYAERNAINAPIQGSAADIIKIAMIRIQERLNKEQLAAKMILQIHDELNFSVPLEEKDKLEKIVIEEMQNAYQMRVPLIADFNWGTNWLEAH